MSKTLVAAVLVGILVVAGGLALLLSSLSAEQPIAFNHRLHVEDVGTECTDCHLYALTGVRATIPNIQNCADCHSEPVSDSPAEANLVEHVESGTPIPWLKIYWLPDDVYFSHLRHSGLAEIECEECHGSIRDRETPVTRQLIPISMDRCMLCHEQRGVTNDCITCHR